MLKIYLKTVYDQFDNVIKDRIVVMILQWLRLMCVLCHLDDWFRKFENKVS